MTPRPDLFAFTIGGTVSRADMAATSERMVAVTNRNYPGFGLQTSVFSDHIVCDYRARRDRIIGEHDHTA